MPKPVIRVRRKPRTRTGAKIKLDITPKKIEQKDIGFYLKGIDKILNTTENASDKIEELIKYDIKNKKNINKFSTPEIKEYRKKMQKAIASQLGYDDESRTPVFMGKAGESALYYFRKNKLDKNDVRDLFFGDEGQVTLIRNKAICEDKINFLLKLGKSNTNIDNNEINRLILGQVEFMFDNYEDKPSGRYMRQLIADLNVPLNHKIDIEREGTTTIIETRITAPYQGEGRRYLLIGKKEFDLAFDGYSIYLKDFNDVIANENTKVKFDRDGVAIYKLGKGDEISFKEQGKIVKIKLEKISNDPKYLMSAISISVTKK